MSFRLVPKSVTLNDLERRNGLILRYFTEFMYDVAVKQLIGLHRFQNLLLIRYAITILNRSAQYYYSAIIWANRSDNWV